MKHSVICSLPITLAKQLGASEEGFPFCFVVLKDKADKRLIDVAPIEEAVINQFLSDYPQIVLLGKWAQTGYLTDTDKHPFNLNEYLFFMDDLEDGTRPTEPVMLHNWSGWAKRRI